MRAAIDFFRIIFYGFEMKTEMINPPPSQKKHGNTFRFSSSRTQAMLLYHSCSTPIPPIKHLAVTLPPFPQQTIRLLKLCRVNVFLLRIWIANDSRSPLVWNRVFGIHTSYIMLFLWTDLKYLVLHWRYRSLRPSHRGSCSCAAWGCCPSWSTLRPWRCRRSRCPQWSPSLECTNGSGYPSFLLQVYGDWR